MKVFHLVESLDDSYGGPAKSIPALAEAVRTLEVDSVLLSLSDAKVEEFNGLIDRLGLSWQNNFCKSYGKVKYAPQLRDFLDSEFSTNTSNTVIHTHNLWNYIPYIAYRTSKKYNIPLVASVRGSLYKWSLEQNALVKKVALRAFQKCMLDNCAVIHATDLEEVQAIRKLGVKADIALLPNGVYLDEFRTLESKDYACESLGIASNKKYLLFASRLHKKKGLDILIEVWRRLHEDFSDWELLIAGPQDADGFAKSQKARVEKLKLTNKIRFLGLLRGQERLDAFAASSLFVLPSHTENFGMCVVEALASGLPVVTTKGTPWKRLDESGCGWSINLSEENLYSALYEALSSQASELKLKSDNARELSKEYDLRVLAHKYQQLYDYALCRTQKPDFII